MSPKLTSCKPLVSVLVPIYNTARYLQECIESILRQSYKNLQIILVDDGSTDGSPYICKQYEIEDPRIEFHQITHSGIAAVRNQLIELANGKYSIFVDSDDYYTETHCIERLVEFAEKNDLEACIFTNKPDGNDALKILSREQAIETFLEDNCIPSSMWTKLVRNSIFSKLKFSPDIECGEDVLMTWQLLNFTKLIGLISAKFYNYRNNPNSITSGPFSDAIYSMHLVWDRIVEDCVHQYPQWERLAKQKLLQCYEGLLCSAVRSKTNRDYRITNIRRNIHNNIDLLFTKDKSIRYIVFILLSVYLYDITRAMFSRHIHHINTIR